jgi:hypothetical protein
MAFAIGRKSVTRLGASTTQRRRFLLLDKLAMTAFVVALGIGAAYEYWRALESMFAPLRAILAVH